MSLARVLIAVVVAAMLAPEALATDRYYLDSSGVSPSGRYRIEAKSPDNAGERPRAFAASFTYTLTDTVANKVVWTRKQPMARSKGSSYAMPCEGSPIHVYVNDDGLVAARLCWDSLLLLDPTDGSKRAEADMLKAFPQDEQARFVSHSTAGPRWSQDSNWYFLNVPAKGKGPPATYFVVRPYWNQRLVIDAATGKHVDLDGHRAAASLEELAGANDDVKRLLTATVEEETRQALSVLSGATESLKGADRDRAYRRVGAALHDVGFLKLTQAEQALRALEKSLGDAQSRDEWLRAKVREALRSIGLAPAPGYGVRLYPLIDRGTHFSSDFERPYTATVPVEQRTSNAAKVAVGMTIQDLTEQLGCPDAALYDSGHCYDYDIDGSSPYTLRVWFDQQHRAIASTKTITPLAFLHEPSRMRGY